MNNPEKSGIIHDVLYGVKIYPHTNFFNTILEIIIILARNLWRNWCAGLSLEERPVSYQLVGKVMAYQGNDG